jgi:hypothetical protein
MQVSVSIRTGRFSTLVPPGSTAVSTVCRPGGSAASLDISEKRQTPFPCLCQQSNTILRSPARSAFTLTTALQLTAWTVDTERHVPSYNCAWFMAESWRDSSHVRHVVILHSDINTRTVTQFACLSLTHTKFFQDLSTFTNLHIRHVVINNLRKQ